MPLRYRFRDLPAHGWILQGQELFGAVREGTEMDAFLSDFSHSAKAEYLESAAVRQDALRPVHEGMKAAGFPDKVCSRAEGKNGRYWIK